MTIFSLPSKPKQKQKMETHTNPLNSMSLLTRLEHLDFILKKLERNQNLPRRTGADSTEKPSVPIETAVREAYFKGTLLDRVAGLENRLFQLCFELESSTTTSTSTGVSGESSSQAPKKDTVYSLPTFKSGQNLPIKQAPLVLVNKDDKPEIQEGGSKRMLQIKEQEEMTNYELKTSKGNDKDEGKCKSKKKKTSPRWTHFNILGC